MVKCTGVHYIDLRLYLSSNIAPFSFQIGLLKRKKCRVYDYLLLLSLYIYFKDYQVEIPIKKKEKIIKNTKKLKSAQRTINNTQKS